MLQSITVIVSRTVTEYLEDRDIDARHSFIDRLAYKLGTETLSLAQLAHTTNSHSAPTHWLAVQRLLPHTAPSRSAPTHWLAVQRLSRSLTYCLCTLALCFTVSGTMLVDSLSLALCPTVCLYCLWYRDIVCLTACLTVSHRLSVCLSHCVSLFFSLSLSLYGDLGNSNTPHSLRLDLSGFKRKNCNSLVTTIDDTDENLSMYSV